MMSFFRLSALSLALIVVGLPALAQNGIPDAPDPIKNLAAEGAQVRYLGREHGFDSWVTIKNGQEQYFYVPPGGSGFVMGVLFDNNGKLVTIDQVQRLRENGDETLDALAEGTDFDRLREGKVRPEFQSASERMFYDIENSNWIALGQSGAPVAYAFVDSQCGHCHKMLQDMRKAGVFENGRLQLRLIPVGFRDETIAQAAFLMAAPDPQDRMFRHLDGDESALPVKPEINQQGVQRNLAIMQSWDFSVTPMLVYRGKDGGVKIVRGTPRDLPALLGDLGARN